MKPVWKHSILAAAAALCTATAANAASFVNVQILGSATQTGTYTSNLTVTPGEPVFYEVVAELNQSAVSNATKVLGSTYTLVQPQSAATDGVNSLGFSLSNSDSSGSLGSTALASGWNGISGAGAGTVSGESVSNAFAGLVPGSVGGGTSQVVILTGSLTAGSASSDTLSASFDPTSGAGFTVNSFGVKSGVTGATADHPFSITSLGTDPLVSFAGLSLSESQSSPVPTPGIIPALLALSGGFGLLSLYRRRKLA